MYDKTAEIITAHSDNTNSNMLSLEKQSDNETFHISQLPILFNTMDLVPNIKFYATEALKELGEK